ncbi:NAD(P)-binding protein [Neurospora crassa]|uniref:Short-chain dehydrogenase n=1 Tax=Neurospora crassa (strain ATCC 24698 / 74-OR23-1A / CBS 708.71 / DSM 1257 / FGSC 987) TaxID=367110 RepID=Q7SEJ0_NEUCR|nr:short-chain dehydrogenase [Neurospora crassa OR74A]EAA35201.2 short-chain dehydrogenase [Neurospora crassa OR74A]KHE81450.1 NAD(P)-binding protein [Neurospora crassa]|eukprot:XP_964437.2 short-chain dehydrogenase [Neurospora crassa OR74A]
MSGITFGFNTEGLEVVRHLRDQVSGRTFLITGPSEGGLGAETAISLAHANPALLILVGRSLNKIQPTIDAIHAVNPSIAVKFIAADLTSLNSVREAARSILDDASIAHIDVLINNAAVMACPYELTVDGFEMQFATAHLGHFVLTKHILPKLRASAGAGKPQTRIINVSSLGNTLGGIRWDDPSYTKRPEEYKPWDAYGQAKTANVLFTVALNKRLLAKTGIRSYALHPGGIYTPLLRHMNDELMEEITQRVTKGEMQLKTVQQGCATTLRAALDPELEKAGEDGVFLSDCQFTKDPELVAPRALDEEDAERLWGLSEELVGEKFEL